MADVDPQTTPQASPGDSGRDRRGARQAAAGDRHIEDRPFAAGQADGDRSAIPSAPSPETGLRIQHEAVQAGQEMLRMGQQTATQTAELWRQSLEPLAAWQTEMKRWCDKAWGQMSGLGVMRPLQTARPFAGGAIATLMGAPAADLEETEDAYQLCIEVPGMAAEDLKLNVRDGRLAVSGQKTQQRHDGGGAYQISERRYGSFERIFPLPTGVDQSGIDAKLESGLLKINLPKTAVSVDDHSQIEVRG